MEFASGIRSWMPEKAISNIKVNDIVYVQGDYFDTNQGPNYSANLLYKEKSLLKGVVLTIYSNTFRVKFFIDNCTTSINKAYVLTEQNIGEDHKKFILPKIAISDEESHIIDDSDDDPTYTPDIPGPSNCETAQAEFDKDNVHEFSPVEEQPANAMSEQAQEDEVFLSEMGKQLFAAKLDVVGSEGDTVHGRKMLPNKRRFFITKVLNDAFQWSKFDEDVHCAGSAILWNIVETSLHDKYLQFSKYGFEGSSPTPRKNPKKRRKRDEQNWKRNKQKRKRQAGEEFVYQTKKGDKVKLAKAEKEACAETCKKQCTAKLTEEDRKKIHQDYWGLPNLERKRLFISKCVRTSKKNRERKREKVKGKRRDRQLSRSFQFIQPRTGEAITVCQKFFLNTLDISEKAVRTVLKKTKPSGVLESDQRGHASDHNKIEEAVTNQIKEHIMLFKTVESHYIRRDSQCQYLPDHLSISEMYRLYCEWCKATAFEAASYGWYYNVFKTQFNLKFHKPKKDQCDECVGYYNTPKHLLTDEMKSKQQKHIAEKELARLHKDNMKKEVANDATILVAGFDFQRTLLSPDGKASSFYYSLRLKKGVP